MDVGVFLLSTATATQRKQLFEALFLLEKLQPQQIDREAGIIKDVKLLGRVSRNGRRYADRALNDAARLYEGARVYLDHPTTSELRERQGVRSTRDLAGQVRNPRRVGDDIRGDIHLLAVEPARSLMLSVAETMPGVAGMSHRVIGKVRSTATELIVESLDEVKGLEFVTEPATAAGLFESITDGAPAMKDITIEQLKTERSDLVEAIRKQAIEEAQAGDALKAAQAETAALKKQLDEATAQAAVRARKELVEQKLTAAKLPKAAVTDLFRTQLEEAKDAAAIDQLIADRKALVEGTKPAARSTERTFDETVKGGKTGDTTPIDEAAIGDIAARLGVQLTEA